MKETKQNKPNKTKPTDISTKDRSHNDMEVSQVTGKETTQCWCISKCILFPTVRDYKRFTCEISEIQYRVDMEKVSSFPLPPWMWF